MGWYSYRDLQEIEVRRENRLKVGNERQFNYMAFKLRQDVYHAQTRHALLDNSLTVYVGDLITPISGSSAVTNNSTTLTGSLYVLGVVTGFCGPNDEVISQGQAGTGTTASYVTTIATNIASSYTGQLTGGQIYAQYVPITPEMEFSALLSATAATTTLSDQAFVYFNLTDARTVNEGSVVSAWGASNPLQVFSYGLDPADTTNHTIICRIAKAITYNP